MRKMEGWGGGRETVRESERQGKRGEKEGLGERGGERREREREKERQRERVRERETDRKYVYLCVCVYENTFTLHLSSLPPPNTSMHARARA